MKGATIERFFLASLCLRDGRRKEGGGHTAGGWNEGDSWWNGKNM